MFACLSNARKGWVLETCDELPAGRPAGHQAGGATGGAGMVRGWGGGRGYRIDPMDRRPCMAHPLPSELAIEKLLLVLVRP